MNWAQAPPISAACSRHQAGVWSKKWTLAGGRWSLSVRRWPGSAGRCVATSVYSWKKLDLAGGGANPEPLPDQPVRGGVVRAREDDVTVGVELGLFPLASTHGVAGSSRSAAALELVEDLQGWRLVVRELYRIPGGSAVLRRVVRVATPTLPGFKPVIRARKIFKIETSSQKGLCSRLAEPVTRLRQSRPHGLTSRWTGTASGSSPLGSCRPSSTLRTSPRTGRSASSLRPVMASADE